MEISKSRKSPLKVFINKFGMAIILVVLCIVMSIANPRFITTMNILNVLKQISLTGIVAIGMTFVILQADIDLSVGSVAALGGIIASVFTVNGMQIASAIIIALVIATALGLLTGFIITRGRVHAFVVTLGMLSVARGATYIITDGKPISSLCKEFCYLGGGTVGPIPMPVILFVVFILVAWFVLTKTPFGRYVYAIGGNQEATALSGINVKNVRMISFGISSFCACFAGILLAGRVASGQPTAADGWELDAIAAVVIGGTSMNGGKGGVFGTLIGALFMGVLRNGLNLLQVSTFYQTVFIGVLIITVVVIDSIKKED